MRGADDLEALLAFARGSHDVLGVYVFGSRGRADGLVDERSDWDVAVVLRDDADVADFDARWPYVHAPVEIARATLSELRAHTGPVYESVVSGSTRPASSRICSRRSGCWRPTLATPSCVKRSTRT